MDLLPAGLRRANDEETADYLAGYIEIDGAYETEEGLLVPQTHCHCGEEVTYDSQWQPHLHRRCYLIP